MNSCEEAVYRGIALCGTALEERAVEVIVSDGVITAVDEVTSAPGLWIVPCFFNAHTHLADTVAMDVRVRGTLAELVAPPDGLKHRLLARADDDVLRDAIMQSIGVIASTGCCGFADFREGGAAGVTRMREASADYAGTAFVLGRDGGELIGDGFGIASIHAVADLEEKVQRARAAGKMIAIHAGEAGPGDMDEAIALKPDLIIHATHATKRQLGTCAEAGIPIAVCPRSNWALGVAGSPAHPPIRGMLDAGCTVLLGTDNVMFVQPDMLAEMAFTSYVYGPDPLELVRMATAGGSLFGSPSYIEAGNQAKFFLVDPGRGNLNYSNYISASVVKRLNPTLITRTIICP
jgi:cytosine/adenosine deaminase-related metal-dependent hydrolase